MFAQWKKPLVMLMAVVLAVGVFGASFALARQASSISIVDSAGRLVKIPQPLERVVVLNPPVGEVMRALGVTDTVIGVSGTLTDPVRWPNLCKLPVVAKFAHSEPDYEKIIKLSPQVVITYGTHPAVDIQKLADTLAPAGITVVGIDCYKLDTLFRDIATLGIMFNKEAQAARFTVFLQDILDGVNNAVASLGVKKEPKVYFEGAMGNYMSYGASSSYTKLIKIAGGTNIFADMPMPYVKVDPEAIIKRNPDVIIKTALGMQVPIGFGVTNADPIKAYLAQFTTRPGWKAIDAVKHKRVYVFAMDLMSGPTKVIAVPYIAKALHPEVALNPQALLQEYFEKWQGVAPKGIFIYPQP